MKQQNEIGNSYFTNLELIEIIKSTSKQQSWIYIEPDGQRAVLLCFHFKQFWFKVMINEIVGNFFFIFPEYVRAIKHSVLFNSYNFYYFI